MENTSKVIKEIRQQLQWNQAKLAEELGVSFATVNRWERGHFAPSPVALRALKQLCRENGIDYAQYEENYRRTLSLSLELYSGALDADGDFWLDACAEAEGESRRAHLAMENATLLYLTNAGDFLFLNAFLRGILSPNASPERYRRCQELLSGVDIVVTYGVTNNLSRLIGRFYAGEITDRALGACLSMYTVGQGYFLISPEAKASLTALPGEAPSESLPSSDGMQSVLKKYRRDGFYFDEILDSDR